jgi:hypothetical protein
MMRCCSFQSYNKIGEKRCLRWSLGPRVVVPTTPFDIRCEELRPPGVLSIHVLFSINEE